MEEAGRLRVKVMAELNRTRPEKPLKFMGDFFLTAHALKEDSATNVE